MKKIVILLLISLFALSCVSAPSSNKSSTDNVVKKWAYGLEEKEIDTLMDTYWPEAVFTFISPEGDKMVVQGSDKIRTMQEGSFVNNPKLNVLIDESESENNGSTITYTMLVEIPDKILINTLELEERDKEWRIINQTVQFQ